MGALVRASETTERPAHAFVEGHVGAAAAEDDNGIAGRSCVSPSAQASPDAERVDDADARAGVEQLLDPALRRVRLARPGGADDGDPLVERGGGQRASPRTLALGQ